MPRWVCWKDQERFYSLEGFARIYGKESGRLVLPRLAKESRRKQECRQAETVT